MKTHAVTEKPSAPIASTPRTCSASPLRREHLIKGMRYWLNRARTKLDAGYQSHAGIAIVKAEEALTLLEAEILRG